MAIFLLSAFEGISSKRHKIRLPFCSCVLLYETLSIFIFYMSSLFLPTPGRVRECKSTPLWDMISCIFSFFLVLSTPWGTQGCHFWIVGFRNHFCFSWNRWLACSPDSNLEDQFIFCRGFRPLLCHGRSRAPSARVQFNATPRTRVSQDLMYCWPLGYAVTFLGCIL